MSTNRRSSSSFQICRTNRAAAAGSAGQLNDPSRARCDLNLSANLSRREEARRFQISTPWRPTLRLFIMLNVFARQAAIPIGEMILHPLRRVPIFGMAISLHRLLALLTWLATVDLHWQQTPILSQDVLPLLTLKAQFRPFLFPDFPPRYPCPSGRTMTRAPWPTYSVTPRALLCLAVAS
jgi:hypothetical protein